MYCPEKLKLNKFKGVKLPKNRDYMTRLGFHEMPASQFTGDDEAVDFENRKTETLNAAQYEMLMRQRDYEKDKKSLE